MVNTQRPIIIVGCLLPGLNSHGEAIPQKYDDGYQFYQEDSDRIRVEAHYLRAHLELSDATSFRMQYLHDAISGSSPTGALPGGIQPVFADLEDVREGILGALSHQFGDHRIEFEYSRSEESDYISNGFVLSHEWELNQKNTTLAFGVNYLDDTVQVVGLGGQKKETFDFFAGITQIIDKNTTVSANLTLGYSDGYLNDPYKVVQRDEVLIIPPMVEIPIVILYPENRPGNRFRQVLQLGGGHYFESLKGALHADLRLSHDDYGVFSQMAQLEWRQEVGEDLLLTPFYRFYHQNAADFFVNTLNDVIPVGTPPNAPDGSGPNYSSDYRLSSLIAQSVGLRSRYQISDNLAVSAAYERYVMEGVGSETSPTVAYPSANIFTLGASLEF